jgi:hypothetical protein
MVSLSLQIMQEDKGEPVKQPHEIKHRLIGGNLSGPELFYARKSVVVVCVRKSKVVLVLCKCSVVRP